jgi:hypothetical protein
MTLPTVQTHVERGAAQAEGAPAGADIQQGSPSRREQQSWKADGTQPVPTPAPEGPRRGRVIPVGKEPAWPEVQVPSVSPEGPSNSGATDRSAPMSGRKPRSGKRQEIRDPFAFYAYKNHLDELRVFREETMRTLRRAELCVWMAIHGCQHKGAARISQQRIAEVAGIKGRRHVGEAIESLCRKGLLEVLFQGRYRPNGGDEHGLASVYRAYPRPELHLHRPVQQGSKTGATGPEQSDEHIGQAGEGTTQPSPEIEPAKQSQPL